MILPQMVEFTNQVVIALSNAYPPEVYSDPNPNTTNPAFTASGVATVVDAFGVVTVNTVVNHGVSASQGVGTNIVLKNVTPSVYNGTFVVINIPGPASFKVVNLAAIGAGSGTGGDITVTTIPVVSNFVPAFPAWTASVNYAANSIIVPTVTNGHYYKAVQPGTSGASQPTFPTGFGAEVVDGQIIWRESGLLNTAAPAPPGAAHITVYAGSLWVWNTSLFNTTTGLDGPCSLRMSDVNNLNSWNPINQAFLDKDDGQQGQGLATFTITAQGIPPEGNLCALKTTKLYQIVGVFGADNFAIQRAQTDMGTIAPRTIQFIPGFGIGRLTHLGVAVFDGVNDRIVSTQIEPYLFDNNDPDDNDINAMDPSWQGVSWSAMTANPPMYVSAIPVGPASGSALTRLVCYDLILKGWAVVDLPFPVSTMFGNSTTSGALLTLLGSFNDGTLQRWQATDLTWAESFSGSPVTGPQAWSLRTPTCASKDPDERLYDRRLVVVGQQTANAPSSMAIEIFNGGVSQGVQRINMPTSGYFQIQAAGGTIGRMFYAVISGQGMITIDSMSWHLVPRPIGVMAGAIS